MPTDYIVVEGVKPWDGRYEFVLPDDFTIREWGWTKRHAGYMPLTIGEGLEGGDPELFLMLALIAMQRAGKIRPWEIPDVFERISESNFERSITLDMAKDREEEEEPQADPSESSSENESASGTNGRSTSETISPDVPRSSGTPASDTSASIPTESAS